jgi:hypothetical protein
MALGIGLAAGDGAAATPGCASYSTQAAAQNYFVSAGGDPRKSVGGLDADRDGVACEELPGPYKGFATLGYNVNRRFFYGAAAIPPAGAGGEGFPCLLGNRHFADGPRLLTVFRVTPGEDQPMTEEVGTAADSSSGRLVWKKDVRTIPAGRYYAAFEARIPLAPYGPNECPGFNSATVTLP